MKEKSSTNLILGAMAVGTISIAAWLLIFSKLGPKYRDAKRNRALQARLRILVAQILPDPNVLRTELCGERVFLAGQIPKATHKAVLAALYAIPEVHDVVDALTHEETAPALPSIDGSQTLH